MGAGKYPKVSIVVVTWNSSLYIEECLDSISGKDAQIIVVDNHSDDDTVEKILRYEVLLIKNNDNCGYARGNNSALRYVSGSYIVFLNPDTKVQEGSIEKMAHFLDDHADVGVIGPALLARDGSVQHLGKTFHSLLYLAIETFFLDRFFPLHKTFGYFRRTCSPDIVQDVDWITGSCLMTRKDVIDRIGGFDEKFFMYFEEPDFCLRAKNAGYRAVYYPEAHVYHYGGSGIEGYPKKKIAEYHKSLLYYFEKHKLASPFKVKFIIFVRSFIRILIFAMAAPILGRKSIDKISGYLTVVSNNLKTKR